MTQLPAPTLQVRVQAHDRPRRRRPVTRRHQGLAERAAHPRKPRLGIWPALGEDDQIERHGVQFPLPIGQERVAPPQQGIHRGMRVRHVRRRVEPAFDHVLIEARLFIPEAQGHFKASGHCGTLIGIQTGVVDAAQSEDDAQIALLVRKTASSTNPLQVEQRAHRPGLLILPGDRCNSRHTYSLRTVTYTTLAGSYRVRAVADRRTIRSSWGSRCVIHRATKYRDRNMTSAVRRAPNNVNVAPPTMRATKKSRRSAPPMVNGRFIEA